MKIFKTGDLVYSYASRTFMIILKVYDHKSYDVYCMSGKISSIIDVTITHIDDLESDYRDQFKIF